MNYGPGHNADYLIYRESADCDLDVKVQNRNDKGCLPAHRVSVVNRECYRTRPTCKTWPARASERIQFERVTCSGPIARAVRLTSVSPVPTIRCYFPTDVSLSCGSIENRGRSERGLLRSPGERCDGGSAGKRTAGHVCVVSVLGRERNIAS